jgi:heme exporter protein B
VTRVATSPPGFLRASWLVAAKDLRIEWRTLETLASMLLFTLVVLVVFSFAFGFSAGRELGVERLVPGVIWTAFSFSAIVGFARSFQSERRNDTWTALHLSPVDRGSLFLGKTLSNLVKVLLLEAFTLPLTALFFDFNPLPIALPLVGVVLLHTVGLVELGTMMSAVATRLGRGETLVAILVFPFCAPLFISAIQCTSAVLAGDGLSGVRMWLALTAGYDVLFFLVALLTFEYLLEE